MICSLKFRFWCLSSHVAKVNVTYTSELSLSLQAMIIGNPMLLGSQIISCQSDFHGQPPYTTMSVVSEVWSCGCLFKRLNINLWQSNKYVFLILAFKMLHNLFLVNSRKDFEVCLFSANLTPRANEAHTFLCLPPCVSCCLYSMVILCHLFLTSKSQYLLVFLSLGPLWNIWSSSSSEPFFNNQHTHINLDFVHLFTEYVHM